MYKVYDSLANTFSLYLLQMLFQTGGGIQKLVVFKWEYHLCKILTSETRLTASEPVKPVEIYKETFEGVLSPLQYWHYASDVAGENVSFSEICQSDELDMSTILGSSPDVSIMGSDAPARQMGQSPSSDQDTSENFGEAQSVLQQMSEGKIPTVPVAVLKEAKSRADANKKNSSSLLRQDICLQISTTLSFGNNCVLNSAHMVMSVWRQQFWCNLMGKDSICFQMKWKLGWDCQLSQYLLE